jgi:hypothetical protein
MPSNCASTPRQSNGSAPNGCGYIDTPNFESGTGTSTYSACSSFAPPTGATGYKTGYVTYSIPGSGTAHLTGINFQDTASPPNGRIKGKSGQITWIWIDNLRLSVPGLNGGGPSKIWREVSATAS